MRKKKERQKERRKKYNKLFFYRLCPYTFTNRSVRIQMVKKKKIAFEMLNRNKLLVLVFGILNTKTLSFGTLMLMF